jgi:hypothetical protein
MVSQGWDVREDFWEGMEQAVLLGLGSSRLFESLCGLLLQYTHTGSCEEMIFIWAVHCHHSCLEENQIIVK